VADEGEQGVSRDASGPTGRSTSLRTLLVPLIRGSRWRLALLGLITAVGGLAEAAVLVIVARTAFALGSGESSVTGSVGPLGPFELPIGTLLGLAGCITIVRLGAQVVTAWQVATIASETVSKLRKNTIRLFLEASWGLQSRERDGHLQEISTTYVTSSSTAVLQLVAGSVALLNLVVLLASALAVNFVATLAAGGAVIVLALVLRPIRWAVRRRSQETARANLAYATAVTEMAATAREIKIFNVQDPTRRRIDGYVDAYSWSLRRARFLSQVTPGIYQGVAILFVLTTLAIVYWVGLTGLASLGGVILIMLRSLGYGQTVQASYQGLHDTAPYLERLLAEQRRYGRATVASRGRPVGHIDEIALENVNFEYDPGRPVLRDISFRVRRGEIIGIVGPSGSGKSTLVQLLLRLREPTAGSVLADGQDVRCFSRDDWYARVSFVPQDTRLVSGTVADNIRFFRDGIDGHAIERAARMAHLHEDVMSWPSGYDTPIGERGDQLSGGQRQRLSIARSLAADPDVMVLDEPTSALDPRSEALVRDTLTALAPRVTVFIIAHRLSTLDASERIMILQAGELVAFDTPEKLELSSSAYRETLRLAGLR
jgi:ABC-type multidrug transport system fused ATPase/permease subunit